MTPDPRDVLKIAQDNCTAALARRDQARSALERADDEVKQAEIARATARATVDKHLIDESFATAAALGKGRPVAIVIDPRLRASQVALSEVETRLAIVNKARDQIRSDLAEAEVDIRKADTAVMTAAESVILAELEEQCSVAKIDAAVAVLVRTDELVRGCGRLWRDGGPLSLTPKLRAVLDRLGPLKTVLAQLRGQRPILSAPYEERTMRHLSAYRDALTKNADVKLDDIAVPPDPVQQPPNIDILETTRRLFAPQINAAIESGKQKVASM